MRERERERERDSSMTMNLIKVKARENSIGFQLLSNFTPHVLSFFFFFKR